MMINFKKILRIMVVIQFIILLLGIFFYSGQIIEYKNTCPKSENVSVFFGGYVEVDNLSHDFEYNKSWFEVAKNGS